MDKMRISILFFAINNVEKPEGINWYSIPLSEIAECSETWKRQLAQNIC